MSTDSRTWVRVGLGMFVLAFGANLFAPLLLSYRAEVGLTQPQVTFLLAVYVLGLVPALLIGGPLSDVKGRRAMIRPALILGGVGSAILALGAGGSFLALSVGRLVAGTAIGLIMAAGAAWLQELSTGPVHLGARRATVALSLGFGGGPLLAGLIAEFLPHPNLLPYLVHIVLLTLIAPLVWRTPGGAPRPGVERRALFSRSVLSRHFLFAVAAWAPWGFGAVATSFAVLPALVDDALTWPVAFTGLVVAVTMGTGVLIQPLVSRFGSDLVPPAILGLGFVILGMLAATAVAVTGSPWLVFPAAVLLGAAYGVMMVSGLREVQIIAPPRELGAATAVFYSLTYVGFFVPLVLSYLGPLLGYPPLFLGGAVIAAASIGPVVHIARGRGSAPPPQR
ncbi:major facilitator superfamily permease [Corynebacterium humireducens NBRC 106098 = DSM 45392]|uniref:Major facilitator superfamily permease n=1 Tax=Corynebacterium humireducens NBRC 106098 = DSM 45392 TaxID=1223515 RepID=A0A0B5DBJ2_9CORY|nr:MFS transporter [Corynebacterium humireducens]AJE34317.1 major facilitator superfamily permease [Corynebacterium humireducens NBRC 106098 = DSM 45392]